MVGRQARRLGVAVHGDALHQGQVTVQPAPALGQGLLMGIEHPDRRQFRFAAHQVVVDAQANLAGDAQGRAHEHVQGVIDHPLGGVLHRHHPVMAGAGLDLAEDVVDGRHRHGIGGVTEVLDRRRLSEGPRRAEEGHRQGLFQGQAGGHDLAEEAGHGLAAERPGVAGLDPTQHLGLAAGTVELAIAQFRLDLGHLAGAGGAGAEQAQQFRVDGVDALAHVRQPLLGVHGLVRRVHGTALPRPVADFPPWPRPRHGRQAPSRSWSQPRQRTDSTPGMSRSFSTVS